MDFREMAFDIFPPCVVFFKDLASEEQLQTIMKRDGLPVSGLCDGHLKNGKNIICCRSLMGKLSEEQLEA